MADNDPGAGTEDAPKGASTDALSPDQVKAQYEEQLARTRAQLSASDRKAAELEAKNRALEEAEIARKGQVTPADALKVENERLLKALEQERSGRALDTRKARFPRASEALGDEAVVALPEDRIAALDARLAVGGSADPGVLTNTAARGASSSTPVGELTAADLEARLRGIPYEA